MFYTISDCQEICFSLLSLPIIKLGHSKSFQGQHKLKFESLGSFIMGYYLKHITLKRDVHHFFCVLFHKSFVQRSRKIYTDSKHTLSIYNVPVITLDSINTRVIKTQFWSQVAYSLTEKNIL